MPSASAPGKRKPPTHHGRYKVRQVRSPALPLPQDPRLYAGGPPHEPGSRGRESATYLLASSPRRLTSAAPVQRFKGRSSVSAKSHPASRSGALMKIAGNPLPKAGSAVAAAAGGVGFGTGPLASPGVSRSSMVFAFRSFLVVWGARPTTCGSAFRFAVRNPRSSRRAAPASAPSESHTD